jgi:RsiW-degrading membrane proteinase PrsW (M82 family)
MGAALLLLLGLMVDWSKDEELRHGIYSLVTVPLIDGVTYAYRGAASPESGFLSCLAAFTLAIALPQEVLKALLVLVYYRRPRQQSWREALLWGLACGAAFGIVEALLQSRAYFNGLRGPEIYLISFFSSVALQAVWTGGVALAVHRKQERLQEAFDLRDYALLVLAIVAVPVLLHGLYSTLLEMGLRTAALGVGAASFLLLFWQIRATERAEPTAPASAGTSAR